MDANDLAILTADWLDNYYRSFVTTWDTRLGDANTVILALSGNVDATIDWGDGTITDVNTPGPHVHDYGFDGTYTVSVTGSVTAYDSFNNGGAVYERRKLISVDSWGGLGFTSMYCAFRGCSNLVSVPGTSDGIEDVTNMSYMFYGASSFKQDMGGWNTSNVTAMNYMFNYTDSFNGNISGWDTSSVTSMRRMFKYASAFNQDLSGWCVTNIASEPYQFDIGTPSWTLPRPVWGTCPAAFDSTKIGSLADG